MTGRRMVLAATDGGAIVAFGPVYTDKGADELRALIATHAGWTFAGIARQVSKADALAYLSGEGNSTHGGLT